VSLIPTFVDKGGPGKETEVRRSGGSLGELEGRGDQNLVALGSETECGNELVQHRCHRNGIHKGWMHLD
jgi:hypothetical protein